MGTYSPWAKDPKKCGARPTTFGSTAPRWLPDNHDENGFVIPLQWALKRPFTSIYHGDLPVFPDGFPTFSWSKALDFGEKLEQRHQFRWPNGGERHSQTTAAGDARGRILSPSCNGACMVCKWYMNGTAYINGIYQWFVNVLNVYPLIYVMSMVS